MIAYSRAGCLVVQAVDRPDVGVLLPVDLPPVAVFNSNSPQLEHLRPQPTTAAETTSTATVTHYTAQNGKTIA